MKNYFLQSTPSARRYATRRGGFTLIELMVVLAIVAVISAITLGTFNSLSDTNQRTGCQAGMSQVYQGLRQYMSDYDGKPPYYDPTKDPYDKTDPNNPAKGRGIGLWALWTFPDKDNFDKVAKVNERPHATYLRNVKVLHCPSDSEAMTWKAATTDPDVLHSELYADAAKTEYNVGYLSYQGYDVLEPLTNYVYPTKEPTLTDEQKAEQSLYLPQRTTTVGDAGFKRQLLQKTDRLPATLAIPRPPQENTVVMWCQYHRLTRDYDNVLFFDGSVQLLPREQEQLGDTDCNPTGTMLKEWQRVPRRSDCDQ